MKVQIDEDGMLRITSETQLETYALRQWCKENPVYIPENGKPLIPANNLMFHFTHREEDNK